MRNTKNRLLVMLAVIGIILFILALVSKENLYHSKNVGHKFTPTKTSTEINASVFTLPKITPKTTPKTIVIQQEQKPSASKFDVHRKQLQHIRMRNIDRTLRQTITPTELSGKSETPNANGLANEKNSRENLILSKQLQENDQLRRRRDIARWEKQFVNLMH